MDEDLKCNLCGLRIYRDKIYSLQLQPKIVGVQNILCRLGVHKYKYIVHLYENAKPLSVAIFKVCSRCGKGQSVPVAYEFASSITKRRV